MKETQEEKFSEKRKEERNKINAEENKNLQYLYTYFLTQSRNICVKNNDELEDARERQVLMLIVLKSRYKIRIGLELRDWKKGIMMMV